MGHGPGAVRWETQEEKGGKYPPNPLPPQSFPTTTPPHTHTHTLRTPPTRAAHTTLPLFHTEAIINTCNNIFTASNSLLQIRTSHSCGVLSCTRGHPLTCTHTHKHSNTHTHAVSSSRCADKLWDMFKSTLGDKAVKSIQIIFSKHNYK